MEHKANNITTKRYWWIHSISELIIILHACENYFTVVKDTNLDAPYPTPTHFENKLLRESYAFEFIERNLKSIHITLLIHTSDQFLNSLYHFL